VFGVEWIIVFAVMFGCGHWACDIARRKNRSRTGFYAIGFLFPVIGVIIAAVVPPGRPGPAPVTVVVVCPRCSAHQDAHQDDTTFRCWQCRTVSPVGPFTARFEH
jgi:hypothetical protein